MHVEMQLFAKQEKPFRTGFRANANFLTSLQKVESWSADYNSVIKLEVTELMSELQWNLDLMNLYNEE